MASTSERTLRLLSLLQTHRHWPGAELAERLEVSARTLRRDVERLRELGYPVDAQRGAAGGYQLAAGAALPPLVLDDDEAVALAVGLLGAAQGPVAGMAETSVRVLAKLVQVMPKRLRRRVDAVWAMSQPAPWTGQTISIDPDALTTLAQACRDTERVEFAYTSADGVESRRRVEPLRIVPVGRRWYLVAYDLDRHDWRSFRLDRLAGSHTTSVRFAPRRLPGGDPVAFVRDAMATGRGTYTVIAVVHAGADAVRGRIGRWADVQPRAAGSCLVTMSADSFDWAVLGLLVTDAEFEIQAPPEFAAQARLWGRRLVNAAAH
jgi:predicted DNA-binding transcriptional regulator YafY